MAEMDFADTVDTCNYRVSVADTDSDYEVKWVLVGV
jgi:hypothetical protein